MHLMHATNLNVFAHDNTHATFSNRCLFNCLHNPEHYECVWPEHGTLHDHIEVHAGKLRACRYNASTTGIQTIDVIILHLHGQQLPAFGAPRDPLTKAAPCRRLAVFERSMVIDGFLSVADVELQKVGDRAI